MGRRGKRHKLLLDDLKEMNINCKVKAEIQNELSREMALE